MARPKTVSTESAAQEPSKVSASVSELAQAFREAFEASKPRQKKTVADRVEKSPWSRPDGSPKAKLKRLIYQHGIPISDKFLTHEQILLCNKIRPGVYLDGFVRVIRRRDKGLDIDYPIRTKAQQLKLVSSFGIRTFTELLETLIHEAEHPRKSEFDPENED